jgi:hypothetical protein
MSFSEGNSRKLDHTIHIHFVMLVNYHEASHIKEGKEF